MSNGQTSASFQLSGKCPASNDLFTIEVMTGSGTSHLLTKWEGMGSSGQVLNTEFWISDLTSLSDKVLKADKVGIAILLLLTVIDATGTVKFVILASICLRMVSTFDTKIFSQIVSKSRGMQVWR